MPFVYILKSLKDGKLYIGTCSGDLAGRIEKHNKGLVRSTINRRPLIVAWKEYLPTLSEARKK